MDPHGVDVLYEADGDHMILGIPDHLQLQFIPTGYRLLDQHLADQAGSNSPAYNRPQLFSIIDQAAPSSSHSIGWPDDDRIAQLQSHLLCLFYSIDGKAPGNLNTKRVHGLLEDDSVLAPLDGIKFHSYDLDLELLQDACARALGSG